ELSLHSLWWNGPDWLAESFDNNSNPSPVANDSHVFLEERKIVTVATTFIESSSLSILLEKYASIRTLTRVTAWLFRFLNNVRNKSNPSKGPLTPAEL